MPDCQAAATSVAPSPPIRSVSLPVAFAVGFALVVVPCLVDFGLHCVPQHLRHVQRSKPPSPLALPRRAALLGGAGVFAAGTAVAPPPAAARKTGLDRPDLLPPGPVVNVIDRAGLLTPSQIAELERSIDKLQRLFGVKLRVLCQRYPDTPGRAIERYWGVDENTIVLVVDDTFPNLLNFNVGSNVELLAPNGRFWTQLRSKYGTVSFIRKNGEDEAVLEAVEAILDGMTKADELGTSILLGL